jgi:hypothetical protein
MATSFFLMSQKAAPAFICNNVPTWHDGTLEFFCRWGEAVLRLPWRTQWASDEDYSFGSSASHCRSSFCWLFSCITKLDNDDCHAWSVGIRPPEIRRRNRTALALDRAAPRAVRQARLRERRKYRVGGIIASALTGMAARFRGGAEAAEIGDVAAKLGNDALRRLSHEVEHRPLVTLAVAIGVGILVCLVSHRP